MKFEDLKDGMVFRKFSPPPYMAIFKKDENTFYGFGFFGDIIEIDYITKNDWLEWFEQECELVDIENTKGSLPTSLIRQLFECEWHSSIDYKL